MGSCCMNNKNLADRLRFLQNAMGPVPSPFDCFLVNRSLKTLKLRMEEHQKNGLIVAKFLEAHPFVEKVQHLLLESHLLYCRASLSTFYAPIGYHPTFSDIFDGFSRLSPMQDLKLES
jgi:cystathionine gamma-lyase